MTVLDEVYAFLQRNSPDAFCDDCIASRLEVEFRPLGEDAGNSRRHANRKTMELHNNGNCRRREGACSECKKEKKVSWIL